MSRLNSRKPSIWRGQHICSYDQLFSSHQSLDQTIHNKAPQSSPAPPTTHQISSSNSLTRFQRSAAANTNSHSWPWYLWSPQVRPLRQPLKQAASPLEKHGRLARTAGKSTSWGTCQTEKSLRYLLSSPGSRLWSRRLSCDCRGPQARRVEGPSLLYMFWANSSL